MSKRPIPVRIRLRRRIHRCLPALLLACLALIGQIGLGTAMPGALAPLLGGDMTMSAALCQDMGGESGSGAGTGHAPLGPDAHHHHHEDCALCPACQAVAAALPLLPDGMVPPAPSLRLAGVLAPKHEASPVLLRLVAAYPRGPPVAA